MIVRSLLAWFAMFGFVALGIGIVLAVAVGLLTSIPPSPDPKPIPMSSTRAIYTTTSLVDGMVLKQVEAGPFVMGAARDEVRASDDEQPQHLVYLDTFWIDQTEVTNAMFAHFIAETGYVTDAERAGASWVAEEEQEVVGAFWQHPTGPASSIEGREAHPVVQVSWNDAALYCEWAGRRLPTEAEWEKAARGTDGRKYPWGNPYPLGTQANFGDINAPDGLGDQDRDDGYRYTAPVGSFPTGESYYGALDMVGNVGEWVADWYDEDYYALSPHSNPTGPVSGERRGIRSSTWFSKGRDLGVAARERRRPDNPIDLVGFRCAVDAVDEVGQP